jgi:hypothetical protein
MYILRTTIRSRKSRFLVVVGVAGAALFGIGTPSWAGVTPATLTPSATQGPNTGGNTITATTPLGSPPFFPGVDVEFQAATTATTLCTAAYATPTPATAAVGGILDTLNVMVISANRLSVNVPNFGPAPLTAKYNICVYSAANANGQLLAQTVAAGLYSIGIKVMVNNVWPLAGPSQGGTAITVFGSNFPTTPAVPTAASALNATLGGLPLLNITVVSPNAFTAVTPAHSPGVTPVPLIVTSASGTTILGKAFTYANGVTVSPSTGPNTRMGGTPVDVQGIGFGGLNFVMTGNPDDKNPHVYLVRGAYDPSNNAGSKKNGELNECANATVVSDTELVCTMNLQASLTGSGTTAVPTRTVTADTKSDNTLTSISPPLPSSDQGERISGAGIAPGTTITTVGANGASATLSLATQATTNGVAGIAVGTGTESATVTAPVSGPNQTPALSAINPPLTQADIGKTVAGTGIPPGVTIVNLNQDGTTAYLSAAPTSAATGTSSTITVSDPVPVPVGSYTLTVVSNGSLAAWPADPSYTQSAVSGASTFTVSDF